MASKTKLHAPHPNPHTKALCNARGEPAMTNDVLAVDCSRCLGRLVALDEYPDIGHSDLAKLHNGDLLELRGEGAEGGFFLTSEAKKARNWAQEASDA